MWADQKVRILLVKTAFSIWKTMSLYEWLQIPIFFICYLSWIALFSIYIMMEGLKITAHHPTMSGRNLNLSPQTPTLPKTRYNWAKTKFGKSSWSVTDQPLFHSKPCDSKLCLVDQLVSLHCKSFFVANFEVG